MNIESYMRRREEARANEPVYRTLCEECLQPDFSCFCAQLKPFDPGVEVVILIHPIEVKRRRIATGRMAHLSLRNSHLIMGCDFSANARLDALLARPGTRNVMLYPGPRSLNLTHVTARERAALTNERLVLFVMDGTWGTANAMARSRNLRDLPRVCFTPTEPSNFRVRRQPRAECVSTIEAIHHTLHLLGTTTEHGNLLHTFDWMVNRQLELAHSLTAKETLPSAGHRSSGRRACGNS